MRPVTTFVRHNGIKALLTAERVLDSITEHKYCDNLFDVNPEYVGSSVRILRETDDSYYIAKYDADGKIDDGNFKILVTTDLHLYNKKIFRDKALQTLVKNISSAKPDLVLFCGDIVLTDFQQIDTIQFGQMMEKIGVYWAIVFGNHEARAEKEFHKYFLIKNASSFPHCLTKIGDSKLFGFGNCKINIMNSDKTIKQTLFLMDSGRDIIDKYRKEHCVPDEIHGYDFIKNNQMTWYENSIRDLREAHGDFKSILFLHIPLCEYNKVMVKDENGDYVPSGKAELLYGGMYESVGCSSFNSGMFNKIKEMGSTQAVVCGHDHVNDFCALYKGIYLVYAQWGGYDDDYALDSKIDWDDESTYVQGATIINVSKDGQINFSQLLNNRFIK